MVTRYEDRQVERKENFKGGEGYLINRVIRPPTACTARAASSTS